MAEAPIVISVITESVPGREDEVVSIFAALITPSRAEEGCLRYELSVSPDQPGTFLFYESFRDQAAIDAHVASAHFQAFLKARAADDPIAKQDVTFWRQHHASA